MPRSSNPILADASLAQAKKNSVVFRQLMRGGHAGHQLGSSTREAEHKGHHVVIRTHYEVLIDGRTFPGNLAVTNAGEVHYHAIPNLGFASAIDLVKCVIDVFPDDFPGGQPGSSPEHSGHTGEHATHAGEHRTRRKIRRSGKRG